MNKLIINAFNKNDGILVYSNDKEVRFSSYKVIVLRQEIRQVASFLKLHSLTRVLSAVDISVVDRINNKLRFNITYHLQSISTNVRYSLVTWVSESDALLSLQVIYLALIEQNVKFETGMTCFSAATQDIVFKNMIRFKC